MKNITFKLLLSLCLLFTLSGCNKQPLAYDYLMQHPAVLQEKMMQCPFTTTDDPKCEVIKHAEHDFSLLVQEAQSNPEQFGEKILVAEKLLVEKREARPQSEQAYQAQLVQVRTLLAVIGMMRVE